MTKEQVTIEEEWKPSINPWVMIVPVMVAVFCFALTTKLLSGAPRTLPKWTLCHMSRGWICLPSVCMQALQSQVLLQVQKAPFRQFVFCPSCVSPKAKRKKLLQLLLSR